LNLKKLLTYISVLLGALIALIGIVFVYMYFWNAIVVRIGEPDQSLIFWYLPILFIGVISTLGGSALLILGITKLRNDP